MAAAVSVMHVGSAAATRDAPQKNYAIRVLDANRAAPRPPAGARPNQRQVSWLAGRRPSPPSRILPVAQWHGLAAYSCGGSCGLGTVVPHHIPCSLSRERPSIPHLRVALRPLSTTMRTVVLRRFPRRL